MKVLFLMIAALILSSCATSTPTPVVEQPRNPATAEAPMTEEERYYRNEQLLNKCKNEKNINAVQFIWDEGMIRLLAKNFKTTRAGGIREVTVTGLLCPKNSRVDCTTIAEASFDHPFENANFQAALQVKQIPFYCTDFQHKPDLVVVYHAFQGVIRSGLTPVVDISESAVAPVEEVLRGEGGEIYSNGHVLLRAIVTR